MKNKDKLIKIEKDNVRNSILFYGVWNGIVKLANNRLVCCTLTNIASLNNPDLLEFYILS